MMPNLSGVLSHFSTTTRLRLMAKTVSDFETVESDAVRNKKLFIEAVLLPLPERKLMVKPEGQRQWRWWTIYTTEKLELDTVLVDPDGAQMRVMSSSDWRAGFFNYELTEGPVP